MFGSSSGASRQADDLEGWAVPLELDQALLEAQSPPLRGKYTPSHGGQKWARDSAATPALGPTRSGDPGLEIREMDSRRPAVWYLDRPVGWPEVAQR